MWAKILKTQHQRAVPHVTKMFPRTVLRHKFNYSFENFSRRLCDQATAMSEAKIVPEEIPKLSTVFVPGRYGAVMYQIAKPFIDVNYLADNVENLKLSCNFRGINLDVENVLKLSEEWWHVKSEYTAFVEREQGNIKKLQSLTPLGDMKAIEKLNKTKDEFYDKIGQEKSKLHDLEDIVMPLLQKVPHILHPNTPLQYDVVELSQDTPITNVDARTHMDIGKHMLHLNNNKQNVSYFMTGKLAELDIAIQTYFMDKLIHFEFLPLSCVDFCKSFIVEAIGYDPDSCITIKTKDNRKVGQHLHLVGGASFETFCAYLSNMNINKSNLPIKYFAVGRRYNALNKYSNLVNLFSVVQSNNIHCLVLSESSAFNAFDMVFKNLLECYSELNIPFRVVNIAAKNLTVAESQRKQLELWSPALKNYIPVAYVSQHDDFVSKRLQITYGIEYEKIGYCHIVEGSFVNVPAVIGCILENFQTRDNDFAIPSILKKYLFLEE